MGLVLNRGRGLGYVRMDWTKTNWLGVGSKQNSRCPRWPVRHSLELSEKSQSQLQLGY